jgi:1,4-alpha-glucan branching enzyme
MPASLDHIFPGTRMGCHLVDGGATFKVWAPNASSVHVVRESHGFAIEEQAALHPDGTGRWHGFLPGVGDRDEFKYRIVGPAGPGLKRDPYARELTELEWNCIVRRSDFPWRSPVFTARPYPDWTIYQLHTGAFYAPHWPRRAGTFLDVAAKLPYLAGLNINAVQLLPVQEFPGSFSLGYNGTDYFSPEMAFTVPDQETGAYADLLNPMLVDRGLAPWQADDLRGGMNQLKALVDLCHLHGLAVIFDLVFNHAGGDFGDESLWFFDRQLGANEVPPRFFNSLYFTDKDWAGGMVFDFRSNPVRQFLIDNALFFVEEYRVDGFRYDEISVIDHESYGRGWDFCQDLTNTLRHFHPHVLQHAEYWPVNPVVIQETAQGGAGFHTTMTDGPRIALRRVLDAASFPGDHPLPLGALADQLGIGYLRDRWRGVNSIENHDLVLLPKNANDHNRMPRVPAVADRADPRSWFARSRARVATGILLTAPGIPMVFMGQEFCEEKQWSDHLPGDAHLLIDWAGFDNPSDPRRRDFAAFFSALAGLRSAFSGLRGEDFRIVHVHEQNRVLAFHRWIEGQGHDVLVVAHLGNAHRLDYRIGFPGGGAWREIFNSDFYESLPNPSVTGNGGSVFAANQPEHGFAFSAPLTLPANSLLVFSR